MSSKPEFPFSPFDGFRFTVGPAVDRNYSQVGTAVQVEVHHAGKPLEFMEICRHEQTVPDKAAQKRLLNVLDAVGGYLNTGGDLDDLLRVLGLLKPLCEKYRVVLPEGWYLLDWIYDIHEDKYVFSHDASGYLAIVEPECYTEVVDAVSLSNDLAVEDREHQDEGECLNE